MCHEQRRYLVELNTVLKSDDYRGLVTAYIISTCKGGAPVATAALAFPPNVSNFMAI